MSRPSWDQYFVDLAKLVSTRATCDRRHVGCVLVKDRNVLSSGYNGALPGASHCDEHGHDLVKLADGIDNCVRTVHAEQNCIAQAAKRGIATSGATAYINTFPCWPCARLLLAAGISEIVYEGEYKNDERVLRACADAGVEIRKVRKPLIEVCKGDKYLASNVEYEVKDVNKYYVTIAYDGVNTWHKKLEELRADIREGRWKKL